MINKGKLKKFSAPILALAIVASTGGLMGAKTLVARANTQPGIAQKATVKNMNLKVANAVQEKENGTETEKTSLTEDKGDAALAINAKITKATAIQTAIANNPGYEALDATIGDENGTIIYEINMVNKAGANIQAKVNAETGSILASDKDNGTDNEKDNGNEQANSTDTDNIEE